MQIFTNIEFDRLARMYALDIHDFPKNVVLPQDLTRMLDDRIVENAYGVGLASRYIPKEDPEGYGQSYYDDKMNAFSISDQYDDERQAFMIAIAMTIRLAKRFAGVKIPYMRVWMRFQTRDMVLQWTKRNDLIDENEVYRMRDRIAFHRRQAGEHVIDPRHFPNSEDIAMLVLEIE